VFTGKLSLLRRQDARALVARLGGVTADEVNAKTTMVVVGAEGFALGAERDKSQKLKRAEELMDQGAAQIEILTEEAFCRLAGVPTRDALKRRCHSVRDLLALLSIAARDHLRYLMKCGIIRPVLRTNADTFFAFQDLPVIKQVNEGLDRGAAFRSLAQSLIASREGQLTLDFRLDVAPAKILTLQRRPAPPAGTPDRLGPRIAGARETAMAEDYFRAASLLDNGDESTLEEAAGAYRRALELDPCLVAALINLANIHYSRDELAEAQALYERAIGLESDFFEAHFNLGNIYHDLGRFSEAQACYREALRLNPQYADAHFYLAVTFERWDCRRMRDRTGTPAAAGAERRWVDWRGSFRNRANAIVLGTPLFRGAAQRRTCSRGAASGLKFTPAIGARRDARSTPDHLQAVAATGRT
jgi:tetratricopeptide (TPR) repeat protein